MAMRNQVGRQYGSVVLAVLVILSIGATAAVAGAPAAPLFQSPPPTPPANDNFADAIEIDTAALPTTVQADNSYATFEWGPENQACYVDRTVWYSFVPITSGTYRVDAWGSWAPDPVVVVYRDYGGGLPGLNYIGCSEYGNQMTFTVEAGGVYYIQAGNKGWDSYGGMLNLNLSVVPPPANDDFANATQITALPFSDSVYVAGATLQPGEPLSGCSWGSPNRSIWYRYTASADGSVTSTNSPNFTSVLAVYTGEELTGLTQVGCVGSYSTLVFKVQAGVTYHFQVTNIYGDYGDVYFNLQETPPPTADFWSSPWDASRYDNIQFCDNSYDPVYQGFTGFWWDFGDGATGTDPCTNHQYAADGDYTVWHGVTTTDGRSAGVIKTILVRTHDIAITKFTVPQSASAGQTRQLVVSVRNWEYPEDVQVELYKSAVGSSDIWVGTLRQQAPVRSGNRTTDFKFTYTFTPDDARIGKVTFKAMAFLLAGRDALPADNTAIALPTKVSRK